MTYKLCTIVIAFAFANNCLAQDKPSLAVGDDAPVLKIEKWLKYGGFTKLEKGKVYVIDLWAVWCMPCIASTPHLSKLQQTYKSKGLEVIGITSEDKYGNNPTKLETFIRQKDSLMNYNIALVPISINKDSLQGIFVHPWMQGIGSMALPTAFIIDRNGKIAYIGDPHTIDKPLDEIINNNYDLGNLRNEYLERLKAEKVLDTFSTAIKANNIQLAIETGNKILTSFKSVKPNTYLILAADAISLKSKIPDELLDIALISAKRGIMLTQFESPGFYDLLASVYSAKGDYFNAVIAEKFAINLSEGQMKENQINNLQKYLALLPK